MEVGSVDVDAGINGLDVKASGGGAPGSVEGDQVVVGACRIRKRKRKRKKRKRKRKRKRMH